MPVAPSSMLSLVSVRVACLAAAAAALTACGGGGDDAPGSPSDASSTPTDAPALADLPAAPGPAPAPEGDISCGLPDFQAEVLRLVNERRAAGATCGSQGHFAATTALSWNTALTTAAYGHSRDMADNNYFSHTSRDGRTFDQRITDAGYRWSRAGENIAAGATSAQAVINGWMASEGHCANLMNPHFRDMGLACARNANSRYGWYWTQTLGTPR
ncbi:MAG: CAP domain-containing protein [Caldimonas sp.]